MYQTGGYVYVYTLHRDDKRRMRYREVNDMSSQRGYVLGHGDHTGGIEGARAGVWVMGVIGV